jgi:hypothetical protein
VFYRKICDNKDLQADINVYNRLADGHPDRSYKWLMNVVLQEITLKRERRNMADRESSIALILGGEGNGRGRNAAATPEGATEAATPNPKAKGAATKTSAQQESDKKSSALQKKVDDSQKELKKLTEALAAATLNPKGGGKGADKGKGKTKGDTPCYFSMLTICAEEPKQNVISVTSLFPRLQRHSW